MKLFISQQVYLLHPNGSLKEKILACIEDLSVGAVKRIPFPECIESLVRAVYGDDYFELSIHDTRIAFGITNFDLNISYAGTVFFTLLKHCRGGLR